MIGLFIGGDRFHLCRIIPVGLPAGNGLLTAVTFIDILGFFVELWRPQKKRLGPLEIFLNKRFKGNFCAEVAELVYAYVSEAYGESLESSSLSFRTLLVFYRL